MWAEVSDSPKKQLDFIHSLSSKDDTFRTKALEPACLACGAAAEQPNMHKRENVFILAADSGA